ncbi:MAG TPA: hypothetical protein VFC23_08345 [Thermoanaerobaculia bacterium]|nr:hypothetical protein [Thermoanaerobaculia bacterium]
MQRSLSWAVLALQLAATVVGAVAFDRRRWPGLVGDEATYLMQAQSLAWDFDLRYSRRDYDRFVEQWGVKPEGLILQSADSGRTFTYSKPASYAAWIAPFLRLSPTRGASIANALLLALAAVAAARTLSRRLGPAAPLWVAAWVFASVAFAYVFWVHSDLFLMCLTAIALALAYGAPRGEERPGAAETAGRSALRWLAAGALLGLVLMSRPFYGALLLPAALAVPRGRRTLGIAMLVIGAGLVVLSSGLANLADADALTPYGGQRQSFDSTTGFPEVDLPAGSWTSQIAQRGDHTWKAQISYDRTQMAWNVLYFFVGRHVGILPYFLPLLLGLATWRRGEGRGMLILAALAAAFCFLLIRPFNFYGGGGALANRYFLPLYPAFWFAAGRPPARASWALLATALAAPFLLPLWQHPEAYLLAPGGGYTYVSHFAQRYLPYETTLSHLKPSGHEDFVHNALWIKLLTPSLRPEKDGPAIAAIDLDASGEGQILIGSPAPLAGVELDVLPPLPQRLDVSGAENVTSLPLPGGVAGKLLHFAHPRAAHRMWWTDDPYYLYQLRLEAPAGRGFRFRLRPVAKPPGTAGVPPATYHA